MKKILIILAVFVCACSSEEPQPLVSTKTYKVVEYSGKKYHEGYTTEINCAKDKCDAAPAHGDITLYTTRLHYKQNSKELDSVYFYMNDELHTAWVPVWSQVGHIVHYDEISIF